MKKTIAVLALTIVTCVSIAGSAAAEDVQISPRKLVAGKTAGVELTVNPYSLYPKPRTDILYAWWCWNIDPRPPECEVVYCDSPVPGDCPAPKKGRSGKLRFEFGSQKELVDKARGACGPTDFMLMAKLADGSVSEAEGTIEIDCGR